jgi:transcriptional regulator with XRE-family HTH domain
MSIAKNIRVLRKNENWTQKKAAQKLGITVGKYASYEQSCADPGICVLIKMSQVFKISLDDLMKKNLKRVSKEDGKEAQ